GTGPPRAPVHRPHPAGSRPRRPAGRHRRAPPGGPRPAGRGRAAAARGGHGMRVLFVVPPLAGHVNPTVTVAAELTARGHQVAWTGPAEVLPSLLPARATLLPAGDRTGPGGYGTLH